MRTGEIAQASIDGGTAVLIISGEHDLNTAPDLRSHLDRLAGSAQPVVVDLSTATFVDSSILGVILAARREAEKAGTGFAVAHSSTDGAGAVGRVLEITGLRAELPVHENRELAAAEAGGG